MQKYEIILFSKNKMDSKLQVNILTFFFYEELVEEMDSTRQEHICHCLNVYSVK